MDSGRCIKMTPSCKTFIEVSCVNHRYCHCFCTMRSKTMAGHDRRKMNKILTKLPKMNNSNELELKWIQFGQLRKKDIFSAAWEEKNLRD